MIITHKINIDLSRSGCDPIIHAAQGDTNTHQLQIRITDNRKKWVVPEGLSALVHYSNSFGSGGSYDTLPDGTPAWETSPNGILITLVPEMMALPGSVQIVITMQNGPHLLSPASILLMVAPLASAGSPVLENYSKIAGFLPTVNAAQVNQILQVQTVDAHGHITGIRAIDPPEGSGGSGQTGIIPHIGSNGNWYLGDQDTGTKAAGEDGYTPVKGKDYFDGQDGLPGHTPVKGVDYYTEADIAEFSAYITTELAKRGQLRPEFANSIEECTDITKLYVLPDGYLYGYMSVEVPSYINHADPTNEYWLTDKRFSTSDISDVSGGIITNYIAANNGDVIRVKGLNPLVALGGSNARIRLYRNGAVVDNGNLTVQVLKNNGHVTVDGDITIISLQTPDDVYKTTDKTFDSIRLNGVFISGYTASDVIITVNEEISGGSTAGYTWANTWHAFVPADYEGRILNLEKVSDSNTSKIKVLEASLDMGANVPGYWVPHLQEKAKAIQLAMESAGRNKSAFLWYTDAHWVNGNSKISPVLLNYLYRNTPMNKVNFGGDIIGDGLLETRDAMRYLYEWRKMIKDLPNHHSVLGNHDNFRSDDVDYDDDHFVYSFLIAPEESSDMVMGGDFYYYIDNPCEKTRYLYLDSGRYALSDDETAFVIAALTNTPSGWHIVAISHIWFQYNAVATPTVGGMNGSMQKLLNLFDAYNSRQSGSITMISAAKTYDFTNCGGRVEFCIGGHIHVDHEIYSTGGIPVILTASDANQERSSDETEDSGTIGTISEAAVFGIVADYNSGTVSVIAVGRGTDRSISL